MTNEQINIAIAIAIAELEGWAFRHIPKGKYNIEFEEGEGL